MKHRYKIAIIGSLSVLANIASAQGWFYDSKMYCIVTDTQVRVTFQKQDNILCQTYIINYQNQLRELARQVLYVDAYITKYEDDKEYRLAVRDQVRDQFYKTYNLKKAVQESMITFDQQLFVKMQKFLDYYINPYTEELSNELALLHKVSNPPQIVTDRMLLIEQQLLTIQNMFAATDFDTLLPHVEQYLYLRKQIIWQLAS